MDYCSIVLIVRAKTLILLTNMYEGVTRRGFALPTVVIVSVVMMALLAVALQSISVTSSSLRNQYYEQLAREAAEAGTQMLEGCWMAGIDVPLSATLTPGTDCNGTTVSGQPAFVASHGAVQTTFEAKVQSSTPTGARQANVVGSTSAGPGGSIGSYSYTSSINRVMTRDEEADRASQRYWIFGLGGGLDFGVSGDSTPTSANWPTPFNSGANIHEGSTVVTNRHGELVFYTDGRTVWNKHGVAHNSTGLLGSSSATQAVATFPLNQEQTRYGIVTNTTGQILSEYEGKPGDPFTPSQRWRLYYSEYDTTLDSGRGGIVSGRKNIEVWPEGNAGGYATEALNAMPNHDGTGYWVYTYAKDGVDPTVPNGGRIYGFLIGPEGIQAPGGVAGGVRKMVSESTTAPLRCGSGAFKLTYGTINFSKDYSRMLVLMGTKNCITTYARSHARYYSSGTAYILDTNRQTGGVTEDKMWYTAANSSITNPPEGASTNNLVQNAGYSADFSPDERYVYVTQLYPGWLTKYNPAASNVQGSQHALAYTSRITPPVSISVAETRNAGGQIRRAPDGRMYISMNGNQQADGKREIICITNPDAVGAMVNYPTVAEIGLQRPCAGVTLSAGTSSWYGLPQMVTVFTPQVVYY